jgi:hypothetical protein
MPQQQPTAYDILGRPLVNKGINYGINRGIQYGWQNWGKPAWDSTFGAGATAATPAAEGAGEGALSGLGSTGLSDYTASAVPALQVVAPLIMGYLRYQAGSGRNEPREKTQYIDRRGRLLSDMLGGKEIDWEQSENQYGVKPKTLSSQISGYDPENANQMIDPRGWTAKELYDDMLSQSSAFYQTGGVGSSEYSGNQINDLFGSQKGKLSEALGLPGLPDWTKHDKGSGFDPGYLSNDPTGQALAESMRLDPRSDAIFAASPDQAKYWGISGGGEITKGWSALDDAAKEAYRQQTRALSEGGGTPGDDTNAVQQFANEQTIKQLNDKYKMGLKNYAERMAARNQGF